MKVLRNWHVWPRVVALGAAIGLAGCAPMVPMESAAFSAGTTVGGKHELALVKQVELKVGPAYSRTLPQGSRWREVGTLPQGRAYRPVGGVFTVEGRQVHEAYLVVDRSGAVVGFYLPVEDKFSPVSEPVQLPLGDNP